MSQKSRPKIVATMLRSEWNLMEELAKGKRIEKEILAIPFIPFLLIVLQCERLNGDFFASFSSPHRLASPNLLFVKALSLKTAIRKRVIHGVLIYLKLFMLEMIIHCICSVDLYRHRYLRVVHDLTSFVRWHGSFAISDPDSNDYCVVSLL